MILHRLKFAVIKIQLNDDFLQFLQCRLRHNGHNVRELGIEQIYRTRADFLIFSREQASIDANRPALDVALFVLGWQSSYLGQGDGSTGRKKDQRKRFQ